MERARILARALAVIVSVSFAATTTAAAAPAVTAKEPVISAVSDQRSAQMVEAAATAMDAGRVTTESPSASLRLSDATVYSVETNRGKYTTVTVPVSGAYSLTSNVSVVFDPADAVAGFTETLVSENAAGNFQVKTFADGRMTSDQATDIPFMTDSALKADLAASQSAGTTEEKNTGACIATVLGVSGVVGGIIAYSCAGACAAAAAGVGVPFCVACIAGFATVGGASITAVASCF